MEWEADRIPRASQLGRLAESVSSGFSCFNKGKRASKLGQRIKKGPCCQTRQQEFGLWVPSGEREELAPKDCPMSSAHSVAWAYSHKTIHTIHKCNLRTITSLDIINRHLSEERVRKTPNTSPWPPPAAAPGSVCSKGRRGSALRDHSSENRHKPRPLGYEQHGMSLIPHRRRCAL